MISDNMMSRKVQEKYLLSDSKVNKELRAIVWLGALLGTLMGCVNIFL